ncbi:MAG: hypothetical protein methR_P0638 [Methyloprofundus sp.]|nr:MAG: hypothetical protein methR_P0638 [Methyloprofundus sp.]
MRQRFKLSAIGVKKKTTKGKFSDGANNLYLEVKATGSKSWIFRYTLFNKRKEMGLGSYPTITLEAARKKAAQLYEKVKTDPTYDPILVRQKELAQAKMEQQKKNITFKWCSEQYIAAKTPEWKSKKSPQQWTNTLNTYAHPILGDLSIKDIETSHIIAVLKPIWETKTETATRVRGRIENILSWAAVQKYRPIENPALWKGHLENLLPKPNKLKAVKHHQALPYKEIHTFIIKLRTHQCISAYALEVLILTATRTSELIGALWDEINFNDCTWTIPPERMKAEKEPPCVRIVVAQINFITKQGAV